MSFSLRKMCYNAFHSKAFKPKSNDQDLHKAVPNAEHSEQDRHPPKSNARDIHRLVQLRPVQDALDPPKRDNPPELLPLSFEISEVNFVTDASVTSTLPPEPILQTDRKFRSPEPRRGSFFDLISGKKVTSSGPMRQGNRKNKKVDDFERYKEMDLSDIENVDPVDIDDKLIRCKTTESDEYRQGYLRANTESPKLYGKTVREYLAKNIDKFRLSSFKSRNKRRTNDKENGLADEEFAGEITNLLDDTNLITSTKARLPLGSPKANRVSISKKRD